MMLNRKGQTLVEYVLIVSLIAGALVTTIMIFKGRINDAITKMGCNISGQQFEQERNEKGRIIYGTGYCVENESNLFE